jgi:hypothetical protein
MIPGEKEQTHSVSGMEWLFIACNHGMQWITFFTLSLARQPPCAARTVPGWRKEAR